MATQRVQKITRELNLLVAGATKGSEDSRQEKVRELVERLLKDEDAALVFAQDFESSFWVPAATKGQVFDTFDGGPLIALVAMHSSVSETLYGKYPVHMDRVGEYDNQHGRMVFYMRNITATHSPKVASHIVSKEPWRLYDRSHIDTDDSYNLAEAMSLAGIKLHFRPAYMTVVDGILDKDSDVLSSEVKETISQALENVLTGSEPVALLPRYTILSPETIRKARELSDRLRAE